MVRVAYGTLDAWNALSASEQAYYDGGHYLLLLSAITAYPGALASDDYSYYDISDTDNIQSVTMPTNTNGYSIKIIGNGYKYNTSCASRDIYINTGGYKIEIENINFVAQIDKTNSDRFIRVTATSGVLDLTISNCVFDMNNYICNAIFLSEYEGIVNVFCNVFKNRNIGTLFYIFRHLDPRETAFSNLENNTFSDILGSESIDVDSSFTGNCTLKNNNIVDSTACINGTYTDGGGNATSDTTGSVGYQSIVAADAMVDPAGGDYRPKKNGPLLVGYSSPLIADNKKYLEGGPILSINSYSGAYGRIENIGAVTGKKRKNIIPNII